MNFYKKVVIAVSILILILIAGVVGYHISPKQNTSFAYESNRHYTSEGVCVTNESFGHPCITGCCESPVTSCDCEPRYTGGSRPSFGPTQVMDPSEINKGYFIEVYDRPCNTHQKLIKVVKEPYLYCSGDGQGPEHCDLVIDAVECGDNYLPKLYADGTPYIIDQVYLTDMGVIPYKSGAWNQGNALLRINPAELPDSLTEESTGTD